MRRILFAATAIAVLAPSATAVDLDELTVVTLARDGSWGVATAASQGPAIAAAIRDCQAMAGAPSDCGAQFVTTRGGWVVAKLCGDRRIIVAAETREAAEREALAQEISLKRLRACTRALTVDPHGVVVPGQSSLGPDDAAALRFRSASLGAYRCAWAEPTRHQVESGAGGQEAVAAPPGTRR